MRPVQRHEGEGDSVGMVRRIVVAIAMLLPGVPALAEEILGRVAAVAGGDAITVVDAGRARHEVRLAHIRAPLPGQPFADRSRQNLGALLFDQEVRVARTRRERGGQVFGQVWVVPPDAPCRSRLPCPKTLDAGMAQVAAGLAWRDQGSGKEQPAEDRGRYEHAEFEAKIRRSGLWSEKNPVPPWNQRGLR
jgi:endonuclease YncB( thermonuclease family)